ncbi:MAG: recombinase family protein [Geminicoccaceae bacterium]
MPQSPEFARLTQGARAYSYLRFSTPEQAAGDSFRRQTDLAERYAAQHGLELDRELTFHDLGVSAFRGANSETGQLGMFLQAVEDGMVPQGSYLLVESLDRISRQKPRKAVRVLERICEAGVAVVTLTDGKVYTEASLDDDPMSLMWALMVAIRANEESETKSRRLRAAWVGKLARAAEVRKPVTAIAPAWLQLRDGKWSVLEDRAEVVRRVFQLFAEGQGQMRIARQLNEAGVPTWGHLGSRIGQHWHRSYINRLLNNPAVIGTYVPYRAASEEKRAARPAALPVPGYFPAVVPEELYQSVQAMLAGKAPQDRAAPDRTKGSSPPSHLLAGLARCPICGGAMTRVYKGRAGKAGAPKLICTKAKIGAGCTYHAVRIPLVEEALRLNVAEIVGTAPSPNASQERELARVQNELHGLEEEIGNLLDALARGFSPALRVRLDAAEEAALRLRQEEQALLSSIAATTPASLKRRLGELEQALAADNAVPANAVLRQLMDAVVVDYPHGQLRFQWKQGGETTVQYVMPQ